VGRNFVRKDWVTKLSEIRRARFVENGQSVPRRHNKLATGIFHATLFVCPLPHTPSFLRYFFLLYHIKSVLSVYECLDSLLRSQRTMSLVAHILGPDVFSYSR
jgi:hypothetical protein